MIFPDSCMYHTTDGVDREKLNPCQVVVREEAMIIEYVDEFGSRVTYQARQIAEGQFEIRQEIEEEDYLYTGATPKTTRYPSTIGVWQAGELQLADSTQSGPF
ncbi:hypothetical protein PSH92_09460 [Pseudomonas beijingensis]|uniref:Uncharacterized protein n=1 Tax=Pseudomonas beijingensis TaxID=2954101 RepID=A0ABY9FI05_9PSED|nr:hypothetical protein [Pseudomonas sp. FP2034]WLH03079.1 hypothetical protein PSH92_09460 [Pseudomonas sp. FP2034]